MGNPLTPPLLSLAKISSLSSDAMISMETNPFKAITISFSSPISCHHEALSGNMAFPSFCTMGEPPHHQWPQFKLSCPMCLINPWVIFPMDIIKKNSSSSNKLFQHWYWKESYFHMSQCERRGVAGPLLANQKDLKLVVWSLYSIWAHIFPNISFPPPTTIERPS